VRLTGAGALLVGCPPEPGAELGVEAGGGVAQGGDAGTRREQDLEADGMTQSGQAGNVAATSAGVPPWAPTPGARNSAFAAARSSGGSIWRGPITAPTGPMRPGASRALSAAMSARTR
jgi:hypothetical protein